VEVGSSHTVGPAVPEPILRAVETVQVSVCLQQSLVIS
jgi:hypothetical protein